MKIETKYEIGDIVLFYDEQGNIYHSSMNNNGFPDNRTFVQIGAIHSFDITETKSIRYNINLFPYTRDLSEPIHNGYRCIYEAYVFRKVGELHE